MADTTPTDRPVLPPWKRVLFMVVTLSVPLVALVLVEGALRIAGFGGYPAFFRDTGEVAPGQSLVITVPDASRPYFFADPDRAGYAEESEFVMPKPAGTFRVMLVGESAAKGYPQPRNLSMGAFLQAMLQERWPDRRVEVINLGTTAVASFPLVELTREAVRQQPDLVVLYVGNNEFFGAYGTASVSASGTMPVGVLPWVRAVRGLAIVQATEGLLRGGSTGDRTLMEQMIGQTVIPADAALRTAAATNITTHVGAMIDACSAAGVPVLVCTTASNEAGLVPLGQEVLDHLSPAQRERLERDLAVARSAATGDAAIAEAAARAILAVAPDHAQAHFFLGKALAVLGDRAAARAAFLRARDLDTMPWRPTSATEQGIREAAGRAGAPLCDIAESFRSMSPEGATAWELLDDHVHPSLRGQAEAARLMANAILAMPGMPPGEPIAEGFDWSSLAVRLGSNPWDAWRVDHTLRVLFGVPFMKRSNGEAFLRFDGAAGGFEAAQPPPVRAALEEWKTTRPHAGAQRPVTGMVARVLLREGKAAEAEPLYRIALGQVPGHMSWSLEYAYFLLACRERVNGALDAADLAIAADAIARGRFLLAHGDSSSGFTERYVGRLHQLRGEWAEAIPFLVAARPRMHAEDLVACDQALVMSYAKVGRVGDALAICEEGIRSSGRFAPVYERLRAQVRPGG
jgi:tetratricopeptide (TPR) repeat protein/lysophospholipase L1-like esterase